MPAADWSDARAAMLLDPDVANLNTGSFGPLPGPVFARVTELRRRLAEEPMDFLLRQLPPLLWNARQRLAAYLGCQPIRLLFTANVSVAINIVASGLRLAAPGEILLTDHEYGAMHWCWERASQRQGLTFRTFPLPVQARTPGEIIEAACRAFSDRTRLFFFSHVLSPTGLVLPAAELCQECRKRGILTVVDGAHAPGMIELNVKTIGADFYAANCHKWMLAPTGSGFLIFGPGAEERVAPMQVSWGWHYDRHRADEPDEYGSTPRLRAMEFEGTRDYCPWLSVPAAIDFQAALGVERIRARIAELSAYVRHRFAAFPELLPWTPAHPNLHGSLTAFRLPAHAEAPRLRKILWEGHRIEAPIVERPDCLLIRVSTHFYNTEGEIDRLIAALPEMLARR